MKSAIKNAEKYNSFRRFIEYLPVFDTPLRHFPTAVGFCAKARAGAIGCGTTERGARRVVCGGGGRCREAEGERTDGGREETDCDRR